MKSEIEIRDKLTYYQTMLASIRVVQMADSPEGFIAISQHFTNEAINLLRSSQERDDIIKKAIAKLPQEDQKLFRRSFEVSWDHVQRLLESRIGILKWILEVCYARAWELENNGWMSYLPDKKKKEGNFL